MEQDETHLQSRSTMNLLKLHFNANYRIHYELMISAADGLMEIGLHFEDGPESTARLLAYFDRFILEIKHELGPQFELERWTKSWGHCFEIWPLEPLTPKLAQKLGRRLAEIVNTLQPMLDEAVELGIAADTPRPSSGRPRFGRRL
jgi:hypothetical protein